MLKNLELLSFYIIYKVECQDHIVGRGGANRNYSNGGGDIQDSRSLEPLHHIDIHNIEIFLYMYVHHSPGFRLLYRKTDTIQR